MTPGEQLLKQPSDYQFNMSKHEVSPNYHSIRTSVDGTVKRGADSGVMEHIREYEMALKKEFNNDTEQRDKANFDFMRESGISCGTSVGSKSLDRSV